MIAVHSMRELRALLKERPRIEILAHREPYHVGEIRRVTRSKYYSFYSVIDRQPRHPVSRQNFGCGEFTGYLDRALIEFREGACSVYQSPKIHTPETLTMSFRFLENEERK